MLGFENEGGVRDLFFETGFGFRGGIGGGGIFGAIGIITAGSQP